MLRPSPNHGTQRLPNDDDDTTISTLLRLIGEPYDAPLSSDTRLSDTPFLLHNICFAT